MSTTDNTIQYQGGLQTRKLSQAPILLFLTLRQALSSPASTNGLTGDYRIEIVYINNILSTILQHFTQ